MLNEFQNLFYDEVIYKYPLSLNLAWSTSAYSFIFQNDSEQPWEDVNMMHSVCVGCSTVTKPLKTQNGLRLHFFSGLWWFPAVKIVSFYNALLACQTSKDTLLQIPVVVVVTDTNSTTVLSLFIIEGKNAFSVFLLRSAKTNSEWSQDILLLFYVRCAHDKILYNGAKAWCITYFSNDGDIYHKLSWIK